METGRATELDSLSESSVTEDERQSEVYRDQSKFLKRILQSFLDNVQPIESGLTDVLRCEDVLSSGDEDLIKAETTRRKRARKLWTQLNAVSPQKFHICFAAIRDKYPHVCETTEFHLPDGVKQDECLRHTVMKRMEGKLARVGDLLMRFSRCSLEEYRIITDGGESTPRWALAFRLCAKPENTGNAAFFQELQDMLRSKHVTIPDNVEEIVGRGFPCICQPVPTTEEETENSDEVAVLVPTMGRPSSDSSSGYPVSSEDSDEDRYSGDIDSSPDTEVDMEEEVPFAIGEDRGRFPRDNEQFSGTQQTTSRDTYQQVYCATASANRDELDKMKMEHNKMIETNMLMLENLAAKEREIEQLKEDIRLMKNQRFGQGHRFNYEMNGFAAVPRIADQSFTDSTTTRLSPDPFFQWNTTNILPAVAQSREIFVEQLNASVRRMVEALRPKRENFDLWVFHTQGKENLAGEATAAVTAGSKLHG